MSASVHPQDSLKEKIDTIVRDEAYDGAFGALSEERFNGMAERIAELVMETLREEELV